MSAVYWVGTDNNIYLKGAAGVNGVANLGQAPPGTGIGSDGYGITDSYINLPGASYQATRIADPAPGGVTSTASAPSSATAGAPAPVFNQAGADNTQRAIDQIGPLLQAALAAEATNHANTLGGFDSAETSQRGAYDTGTTTNQQNYDSNFMDSIRAGIHGLGGLMSLLRGTGAAGGTAEDLARDAVGGTTANDIRGGADTRKENQGQLDSSLSSFLSDLKLKRQAAEDTFANNDSAIQRDSATQRQDLYGKMAGFYGDVGNTQKANDWMALAGNLTPEIAAHSHTQVTPYDQSPVIVHAPNLTAFAPPTQPSVLAPNPDGQVGSGIFTLGDPRRKKDVTATATAPATPALAGA